LQHLAHMWCSRACGFSTPNAREHKWYVLHQNLRGFTHHVGCWELILNMVGWHQSMHGHIPREVVPRRQQVADCRHDEVECFFVYIFLGENGEHGEYDRHYILASTDNWLVRVFTQLSRRSWCCWPLWHRISPSRARAVAALQLQVQQAPRRQAKPVLRAAAPLASQSFALLRAAEANTICFCRTTWWLPLLIRALFWFLDTHGG
jgi:hypothetical protein